MRSVVASEDTVIGGGKYSIAKGQAVVINTERAQRDPKVYGDDVGAFISLCATSINTWLQASEFKPERMLDGKFEALPVCSIDLDAVRTIR